VSIRSIPACIYRFASSAGEPGLWTADDDQRAEYVGLDDKGTARLVALLRRALASARAASDGPMANEVESWIDGLTGALLKKRPTAASGDSEGGGRG